MISGKFLNILLFYSAFWTATALPSKKCYPTLDRLECISSEIITNTTCNFTKVSPTALKVNLGFNLLKPQPQMSLKFIHQYANKKGKLMSGLFDFTLDACMLSTGLDISMLTYMVPKFSTVFADWIHPCPYLGPYFVKNLILNVKHIPALATGEYRVSVKFVGDNDREILVLQFFGQRKVCV